MERRTHSWGSGKPPATLLPKPPSDTRTRWQSSTVGQSAFSISSHDSNGRPASRSQRSQTAMEFTRRESHDDDEFSSAWLPRAQSAASLRNHSRSSMSSSVQSLRRPATGGVTRVHRNSASFHFSSLPSIDHHSPPPEHAHVHSNDMHVTNDSVFETFLTSVLPDDEYQHQISDENGDDHQSLFFRRSNLPLHSPFLNFSNLQPPLDRETPRRSDRYQRSLIVHSNSSAPPPPPPTSQPPSENWDEDESADSDGHHLLSPHQPMLIPGKSRKPRPDRLSSHELTTTSGGRLTFRHRPPSLAVGEDLEQLPSHLSVARMPLVPHESGRMSPKKGGAGDPSISPLYRTSPDAASRPKSAPPSSPSRQGLSSPTQQRLTRKKSSKVIQVIGGGTGGPQSPMDKGLTRASLEEDQGSPLKVIIKWEDGTPNGGGRSTRRTARTPAKASEDDFAPRPTTPPRPLLQPLGATPKTSRTVLHRENSVEPFPRDRDGSATAKSRQQQQRATPTSYGAPRSTRRGSEEPSRTAMEGAGDLLLEAWDDDGLDDDPFLLPRGSPPKHRLET